MTNHRQALDHVVENEVERLESIKEQIRQRNEWKQRVELLPETDETTKELALIDCEVRALYKAAANHKNYIETVGQLGQEVDREP